MHLQVESCSELHHDPTSRAARHQGESVDVRLPLLHLIAHHYETSLQGFRHTSLGAALDLVVKARTIHALPLCQCQIPQQ
eukprot:3682123-Rhodomonas_salina.1